MKRLYTLIILISVMLLAFTNIVQASVPGVPEDDILYGDANNDGVVNILDVIFDLNVIMETPGTPCAGLPTVLYEGQTYNTVQIGDQSWMRENLNVGSMIFSVGAGELQTNNGVIEKYCYGNSTDNCVIYGGLYEWNESMQYLTIEGAQGICPVDWHIPTDEEFTALVNYLAGSGTAGGKMKEAGFAHWTSPNTGATNESGFTALPGGFRNYFNGSFDHLGSNGYFWSSSKEGPNNAWSRTLGWLNANVARYYDYKDDGFSVRCLKDD